MPTAEIITIGTEILLGEILDTNAQSIALKLRDSGIDLYRKTTVGDNPERIAQIIREALGRAQVIITTGGLGPTVDDPTREAVAMAFGVSTEYQPELWEQIRTRFRRFGRKPTENNKRQAYIPAGAMAVENPVGTAPAFIIEQDDRAVISLPGVPSEMEYLMDNAVLPYLKNRYHLIGTIKARLLHTAGVGESHIDDLIGDLEFMSNPTVGLAAHSGQVDVRITAKADSIEQADRMIAEIEAELRRRLGSMVYGVDADTLEAVALRNIYRLGCTLGVVEYNIGGFLVNRLSTAAAKLEEPVGSCFVCGEVNTNLSSPDELLQRAADVQQSQPVDICLGLGIFPDGENQEVYLAIVGLNRHEMITRRYGGNPPHASRWAVHYGLDLLRQLDIAN